MTVGSVAIKASIQTASLTIYTEGLKSYMSQFGEIDACTIMRDPSGRSRGFAFLTYTNAASVNKVMNQVHHLDGKQASRIYTCEGECRGSVTLSVT